MGYRVSLEKMDQIIKELKSEYRIYAPKRLIKRGWKPGTDSIRYAEIDSAGDIVFDEKSDFSPKEVFFPINQTMLYFTGNECTDSNTDDKGIIIFARPCDINGINRLDTMFLKNGRNEDSYYKRLREKVKIFMIECKEGWDNCFCVSAGTNKTDDYSVAVRLEPEGLIVDVKDSSFEKYFSSEAEAAFSPEYVAENAKKVKFPEICGSEALKKAHGLEMWREFDDKCISCGGCNTVCISCSCFDTVDIIYNETSHDGERRRVWSSCMLEEFTTMAGGHNVRKNAGDRLRFKTLHKAYDFKKRFGEENMCVGCGRCDSRCPQEISFSDTINSLTEKIEEVNS